MPKTGRLTLKQSARLSEIANTKGLRPASWWNTATDRSLLKRGLIERCDHVQQLAPQVQFVTHLCRATAAGRAALESARP